MAPPQFKNLGKKAADLFKKNYDYKNEVKVTSKSGGVKIETGGYQAKGLAGYTKANWTDAYLGDVEVEAHSTGTAKGQFKLKNVGGTGAATTISGTGSGDLAAETVYETDKLAATLKVSHNLSKACTGVALSAVLGMEGISVGGSLALKGSTPTDYNIGAEYAQKDLVAALVTSSKGEKITASYYQSLSKRCQLGSSMLVSPEAGTRVFGFGCNYGLDANTTLRSKIDSNGIVGESIEHIVANPNLKLQVSAQFDALGSDPMVAQKFGLSLSLGDF